MKAAKKAAIEAKGERRSPSSAAASGPPRPRTTPAPSSGGSGIRLKTKSSALRHAPTSSRYAAAYGIDAPRRSRSAAMQSAARTTFAAGPAADISAAQPGRRRAHSGSYGAEAQPISELPWLIIPVTSGITTIPIGSRRRCGSGLSVACFSAVRSPPHRPTTACAASWQVVENRNATSHVANEATSNDSMRVVSRVPRGFTRNGAAAAQ